MEGPDSLVIYWGSRGSSPSWWSAQNIHCCGEASTRQFSSRTLGHTSDLPRSFDHFWVVWNVGPSRLFTYDSFYSRLLRSQDHKGLKFLSQESIFISVAFCFSLCLFFPWFRVNIMDPMHLFLKPACRSGIGPFMNLAGNGLDISISVFFPIPSNHPLPLSFCNKVVYFLKVL